jgi:pimeloyl-ACP methyl ester carboxylesterase
MAMAVRIFLATLTLLLAGCSSILRDRIFQPQALTETPVSWMTEAPQEITATTSDGLTLHGYYWPAERGNNTLLVSFHGNGFNQLVGAARAEPFRMGGHGVIVASYRGYGGNPGRPSEKGLLLDGAAWMDKAAELAPAAKRYLFGHSLGAAVALAMAADHPVDGVATLGAFTSMTAMVPAIARSSLRDHFDNLAAIRRLSGPVFLYHGTQDATVPFASAQALKEAGGSKVTVVPLEGGGHQVPMIRLAPLIWSNFGSK